MKQDPVFNPENQSTIGRLLAAREAAQAATATVKTARREVSQASKDLAAEAIRKAQARHAAATSKPSASKPAAATLATVAELLAMPANRAQLLNEKAAFGNAGRETRRVIKRAFASASASDKQAILEKFGPALSAYPNESIS
jgi:hypothetical protein